MHLNETVEFEVEPKTLDTEVYETKLDATVVLLRMDRWRIRMEIRGPGTRHERRRIAQVICQAISKTFHIRAGGSWIYHPEGYWANKERDVKFGVRVGKGPDVETPNGRLGFGIRMERLKNGWTQEDLAHWAGISRAHLSLLERGKQRASNLTFVKIQRVFKARNDALDPKRYKECPCPKYLTDRTRQRKGERDPVATIPTDGSYW